MPISVGQTAPDFTAVDLQNRRIQLSTSLDAPVALIFLNINCPWCKSGIPGIAGAFRRQHEQGVHVLALETSGADAGTLERWATEHELDVSIARDENAAIASQYQIERVPSVVFVGTNGEVAAIYQGASEQLGAIIEVTLQGLARNGDLPTYALIGNGCAP
ncbi:MAG TPA: redoxin domain-containing protein [Abditibacteriaceae bacterium]|jgi:peroxiredoxin